MGLTNSRSYRSVFEGAKIQLSPFPLIFTLLLKHNCIASNFRKVFGFQKLAAGWLRWPAIRLNHYFAGETCA